METKERTACLEELMPLIRERLASGQRVKFSPRGVSMLPMLRQGRDTVTLSPLPETLKKYDLPLYRRANGQYVLHRIVKVGETYTCVGDNQFVYETGLEHGQMIALVSGFARDGREYSATDWRYRLYCRVWHYSRPGRRLCRRIMGWLLRCRKTVKTAGSPEDTQ